MDFCFEYIVLEWMLLFLPLEPFGDHLAYSQKYWWKFYLAGCSKNLENCNWHILMWQLSLKVHLVPLFNSNWRILSWWHAHEPPICRIPFPINISDYNIPWNLYNKCEFCSRVRRRPLHYTWTSNVYVVVILTTDCVFLYSACRPVWLLSLILVCQMSGPVCRINAHFGLVFRQTSVPGMSS